MLDRDLAELYRVETEQITRQVRRNIERFPDDFLLKLTPKELTNLIRQNGGSSWGGTRKVSLAFTEHGILMLSSVLRSRRAILVNIAIMRTFVKFREALFANKKLSEKLNQLEGRVGKHDIEIKEIFETIRHLTTPAFLEAGEPLMMEKGKMVRGKVQHD
jgi:hypothetical protein